MIIQAWIEKWPTMIKWYLKNTTSLRSAKHFHGMTTWTLDRDCLLHSMSGKRPGKDQRPAPRALCSAWSCGPRGKQVPSECHHTPNPHNLKHLNKARLSYGESRAFQESFLEPNSWNNNFILLELTCFGRAHEGICCIPDLPEGALRHD